VLVVLAVLLWLLARIAPPQEWILVGRIPVKGNPRVYLRAVALVFLLAAYGVYWIERRGREAARLLAADFPVYPGASFVSHVPVAVHGNQVFRFRTTDSSDAVAAFYREASARNGWKLTDSGGVGTRLLGLEAADRRVTMLLSRDRWKAGSLSMVLTVERGRGAQEQRQK
jgi:hypothetical protein